MKVRIDALDVTVLRGGADEVGTWAKDHGFRLPPDAPEVLEFYAARSPIFLAAVFDADAAAERGQAIGDGTPVHVTIPTDNPWVPLRILGLGKAARGTRRGRRLPAERPAPVPPAGADRRERPGPRPQRPGQRLAARRPALRHAGMGWVPESAWLTKVRIDAAASQLTFDLAIDASGAAAPSRSWPGWTCRARRRRCRAGRRPPSDRLRAPVRDRLDRRDHPARPGGASPARLS